MKIVYDALGFQCSDVCLFFFVMVHWVSNAPVCACVFLIWRHTAKSKFVFAPTEFGPCPSATKTVQNGVPQRGMGSGSIPPPEL